MNITLVDSNEPPCFIRSKISTGEEPMHMLQSDPGCAAVPPFSWPIRSAWVVEERGWSFLLESEVLQVLLAHTSLPEPEISHREFEIVATSARCCQCRQDAKIVEKGKLVVSCECRSVLQRWRKRALVPCLCSVLMSCYKEPSVAPPTPRSVVPADLKRKQLQQSLPFHSWRRPEIPATTGVVRGEVFYGLVFD